MRQPSVQNLNEDLEKTILTSDRRRRNATQRTGVRAGIDHGTTITPHHEVDRIGVIGNLYNSGRLDEARRLCRSLLVHEPANHNAILLLAMVERRQGNLLQAIRLAQAALRIRPDFIEALINLGAIYRDNQQPLLAEEYLRHGLKLEPNHLNGLMILAEILHERQTWAELEQILRRIIALDPHQFGARFALGKTLASLGRNSEADQALRYALGIRPDSVDALCHLCEVHRFYPGDPILDTLRKVILDPNIGFNQAVFLRFKLANALDEIGDYQSAFEYYTAANAAMAGVTFFDWDAHRRYIEDIIEVYGGAAHGAQVNPASSSWHESHVPIFITGHSRSGKTLIETLLARDDRVRPLGETKALLAAMDQILDVDKKSSVPQALGALDEHGLYDLGRVYLQNVTSTNQGAKFTINTMPGNYKYIGLILEALPTAKIVLCRRDTLDSCLRIFFKHYKIGYAYSYDQTALARHYAAYIKLLNFWSERYGDRILQVWYEDLVTDTPAVFDNITAYCGIHGCPAPAADELSRHELGHWRVYEAQMQPLITTLRDMGERFGLPDLLVPKIPVGTAY